MTMQTNTGKPVTTKAKPVVIKPVTTDTASWHAAFDARIKADATLGTVPTADNYRVALTLGAPGKGKRAGVEALFVAMTLRSEGSTIGQFVNAGQCRTANNWLTYIGDTGPRAVYRQVHVTTVNGARIARLTDVGRKHCIAAGMSAKALDPMAKPYDPQAKAARKRPAKAKGAVKPVTAAPVAPQGNAPASDKGNPFADLAPGGKITPLPQA
jgi:hypothetical protein